MVRLETVALSKRLYSSKQEILNYIQIRNHEESEPFSQQELADVLRKSLFFLKTVDKPFALGYINSIFRDQVWNKDDGFHDLIRKLGLKNEGENPSY